MSSPRSHSATTRSSLLACLCLHHLSPYPKCDTNTPINVRLGVQNTPRCKGIRELCLVRHSLVSVQSVRVLILVRRNTTQCVFDSRSSLHRSDQSPILLHPLVSSIEEMSFSGQTQTKESLHFKD